MTVLSSSKIAQEQLLYLLLYLFQFVSDLSLALLSDATNLIASQRQYSPWKLNPVLFCCSFSGRNPNQET